MLFNSLTFALFLLIVFLFYWFVVAKKLKHQNLFLLIASCFFYACWDWRFLFLLLFSIALDFFTGIKMEESKNKQTKKIWFGLSVIINVGFLGVFKYYNFFTNSFADLVANFGVQLNSWTWSVILPVGISFYTFHGLSYVIDIYNDKIKAEKNYIDYALFVSFFPLLVAGPIERATHLLPQIKKQRDFNYLKTVDGLRQILWGLFKKIVIADNCATVVTAVFNNPNDYSGSTLLLGAVFFSFQIYGDFSGYSDIAIGTARLFGIDLLRNFAFPYFSRDIAEFWRRWHISLSSWFKDYLYIPLGGSKGNTLIKIRNIFIIFLVSGFWHGANWTFLIWGFLNALFILPSILLNSNRNNLEIVAKGKFFPTFKEILSICTTFSLTTFAWIFFRADNLNQAIFYISKLFSKSLFSWPELFQKKTFTLLLIFIFIEWIGREEQYAISKLGLTWKKPYRYAMYYAIILAIFWLNGDEQQFIYFQF